MPIFTKAARVGFGAILLSGVASAALAQPVASAAPDDRDARISQLENEVQTLADEVSDLKRSQAAQIETINTKPPVGVTISSGKPVIASSDGKFTAAFHAVLQLDAAQYRQDSPGPIASDFRRSGPALGSSLTNAEAAHARNLKAGDDFRRARLSIDGTAFSDWDYRLMLDFGGAGVENTGQLYEGWVQYNGFKPVRVKVGAFSPSLGLDDQASTNGMPFLERATVTDLARGLAAGDTRTTVQLFGYGDHWLASGAVTGKTIGVINTGTASAVPQTYGDQFAIVGRLAASPIHGSDYLVHVGVHGSYVIRPANTGGPATSGATPITSQVIAFSNTQELRVDGTKLINTGNINANHASTAGVELAVQKGPFLVQAEYEHFTVHRTDPGLSSPNFNGFYVSGVWSPTGDARKYNNQSGAFDAPAVAHPFSLKDGTWGAWELAARYSDVNLNYHAGSAGAAQPADGVRGGEEQDVSVGVNWFPNAVAKFMFDYQHVRILRLSPNATNFVTPVGAQIGQTYDAFAVRSQFAF